MAEAMAIIAGLGAIATLLTVILNAILKATDKSPAQQDANIDKDTLKERTEAENTGRPV